MNSSDVKLSLMSLVVGLIGAILVCLTAQYYLRRVRMERPAIGVFNGRDLGVVFVLLCSLPVLYLSLPRWLLTAFLSVTFLSTWSIGLRALLSPTKVWLVTGTLVSLNIWMAHNLLGTVLGWQLFWLEDSLLVFGAAVFVSNLYVQGGMRMLHVAWFVGLLAVYDVFFTAFVPLTNELLQDFLGYPFFPAMGFRIGFDNAAIGLGDLLIYGLYVITALKAFGRRGARVAFGLVLTFGALVPALVPLLIDYVDPRADTLVPAQAWFGPPAILCYLWLRRRYGRERTMREFLDSSDFYGRRSHPTVPLPPPEPRVRVAAPGRLGAAPAGAEPLDPAPAPAATPSEVPAPAG